MGYTHYWRNKKGFTDEQWDEFTRLVNEDILRWTNVPLTNGISSDLNSSPIVDSEKVSLNGRGEDGCETLFITKKGCSFDFCKTRRLPYDQTVVDILKLANKINKNILFLLKKLGL